MVVKFNINHCINLYGDHMISQLTYIPDDNDDTMIPILEGERIVYGIVEDFEFRKIARNLNVTKITKEKGIKIFHWNLP